jgi:hypothetical protein
MRSRVGALAVILLIVGISGCATRAQTEPYAHGVYGSSPSNPMAEGTVTRVDTGQRVIVLDNGRMYQVPADSTVYVNGQPVVWSTVRPGSYVTLTNGQLVELRDGRYAVVQTPGATIAPGTAVVTPAPGTAVVTPAPGTVVATPSAASAWRQTIYGRVTDVDRDGEITVKTSDGKLEVRVPPSAASSIRKGDSVQLDVMFSPTSPSALPR